MAHYAHKHTHKNIHTYIHKEHTKHTEKQLQYIDIHIQTTYLRNTRTLHTYTIHIQYIYPQVYVHIKIQIYTYMLKFKISAFDVIRCRI